MKRFFLAIYFPETAPRLTPEKDFQLLFRIAVWCALEISPATSLDPLLLKKYRLDALDKASPQDWGIIIELTGTERLHGNFAALLRLLKEKFIRAKIAVRLAVTPSPGSAWALTRYAKNSLLLCETMPSLREQIAPLPAAALQIEEKTLIYLERLGIRTIGELLRLPRKSLGERFGLGLLLQLDYAFAVIIQKLERIALTEKIIESRAFEYPLLLHEPIIAATLEIFKALGARLQKNHLCASGFMLRLYDDSRACVFSKELALHQGGNHVFSVIFPVISALQIPRGICGITVEALYTSPTLRAQTDFLNEADLAVPDSLLNEYLNTLCARLGKEHVLQVSHRESHIPERRFFLKPLSAKPVTAPGKNILNRPSFIFSKPEEIKAISLLPENPPERFQWRSAFYTVTRGEGPENISAEWWQTAPGGADTYRQYFRVQSDTGRWFWLFREKRSMQWFLHGMWL